MSKDTKIYRIKANPGADENLNISLDQDYDVFEILSLKLEDVNDFKLHSSNYGVIVGRVIANGGFGVPNAKISVFIEAEDEDLLDYKIRELYPFKTALDRGSDNNRYNLLPDYKVDKCHQAVGSLPSKQFILDNGVILEIFDKYYKFSTRTNDSGDYLLTGIPVGVHNVHMDLDLSDCGQLSQRPRDFVYKGYTIEQFENPNQFKKDEEIDKLSQIFTQNKTIEVIPFWGNEDASENIGITRNDFEISFKFEPTCVFIGSLVGDNNSNGISQKCIPTENMGAMDELISGEGSIEMIRKKPDGSVEEYQIKGNELINANGVWCYQIPMNLDYMITDEYGNMIPSNDELKGIPTRARVRFRFSMHEAEKTNDFYFRSKILVPNNPEIETKDETGRESLDYNFGTYTNEESFRDLYWDNVYTVKSYIPRFQKHKNVKNERFTGIKHCNIHGNNNPMPYNNIRIRLPFMFTILCAMIKSYVRIVKFVNDVIYRLCWLFIDMRRATGIKKLVEENAKRLKYVTLGDGLCPELDNWFFSPAEHSGAGDGGHNGRDDVYLLEQTYNGLFPKDLNDNTSISTTNSEEESACITIKTDYLMSCIEMNLAQEYKVINFDFYNDWINGVLYFPRWMRKVRKKRTFLFGLITVNEKIKGCMNDPTIFSKTRYYTQQCAVSYEKNMEAGGIYSNISSNFGCHPRKNSKKQICHKEKGMKQSPIFGKNGGIVDRERTMLGESVYYLKPCEFSSNGGAKTNLFATDLVLLGSLKDCNESGLPQAFKHLTSSSYKMPTNLALTNMEDSGYLFTGIDGTICHGMDYKNGEDSIQSNVGRQSFSENMNIKSGDDEGVNFSGLDDAIPVTEAAGISWNYAGPGQEYVYEDSKKKKHYEDKNIEKRYFPGGHFLGLSCRDSETNIKSCVNLQRICEIGTEISQRQEKVRGYDEKTGELRYYYLVPTGIIGEDEITDLDFRSAFSTMNSRKLFSRERNYFANNLKYKYDYLSPNGFSGELSKFINSREEGPYNTRVDISDEISSKTLSLEQGPDYDPEEKNKTYRRTTENASRDYYAFRFGTQVGDDASDKFLLKSGRSLALPQYENSFYFYFGLKEGATALDDFLKQFFSVCSFEKEKKDIPQYQIIKDASGVDYCTLTQSITVNIKNMSLPLNWELESSSGIRSNKTPINNFSFDIENIEVGSHKLRVIDNRGNELTANFVIGEEEITFDCEFYDFSKKIEKDEREKDIINKLFNGNRNDYGGYILSDGIFHIYSYNDGSVKELDLLDLDSDLEIPGIGKMAIVIQGGGYFVSNMEYGANLPDDFYSEGKISYNEIVAGPQYSEGKSIVTTIDSDTGKKMIHLWNQDIKYKIYVGIKGFDCGQSIGRYNYITISDKYVKGIPRFELYQGCKLLNYTDVLRNLNKSWWTYDKLLEIGNGREITEEDFYKLFDNTKITVNNVYKKEETVWALKRFSTISSCNYNIPFDGKIRIVKGSQNYSEIIFGTPERETDNNGMVELFNLNGAENNFYSERYEGYDLSDSMSQYPTYWPIDSKKLAQKYNKLFRDEKEDHTLGEDKYFYGKICIIDKNATSGNELENMQISEKNGKYILYVDRYVFEDAVIYSTNEFNEDLVGTQIVLTVGEQDFVIVKIDSVYYDIDTGKYEITLKNDKVTRGVLFEESVSNFNKIKIGAHIPYYFPYIYAPMCVNGNCITFQTNSIGVEYRNTDNSNIMSFLDLVRENGRMDLSMNFGLHNVIRYYKENGEIEGGEKRAIIGKKEMELARIYGDDFFEGEKNQHYNLSYEEYNCDYSSDKTNESGPIEIHFSESIPKGIRVDEDFTSITSGYRPEERDYFFDNMFCERIIPIEMNGRGEGKSEGIGNYDIEGYTYYLLDKNDEVFPYPYNDIADPLGEDDFSPVIYVRINGYWEKISWSQYGTGKYVNLNMIAVPVLTRFGFDVLGFQSTTTGYRVYSKTSHSVEYTSEDLSDTNWTWREEIAYATRVILGSDFSFYFEDEENQEFANKWKRKKEIDLSSYKDNIIEMNEYGIFEKNSLRRRDQYIIGVEDLREGSSDNCFDIKNVRIFNNPVFRNFPSRVIPISGNDYYYKQENWDSDNVHTRGGRFSVSHPFVIYDTETIAMDCDISFFILEPRPKEFPHSIVRWGLYIVLDNDWENKKLLTPSSYLSDGKTEDYQDGPNGRDRHWNYSIKSTSKKHYEGYHEARLYFEWNYDIPAKKVGRSGVGKTVFDIKKLIIEQRNN